jgi:hypothetical protein
MSASRRTYVERFDGFYAERWGENKKMSGNVGVQVDIFGESVRV